MALTDDNWIPVDDLLDQAAGQLGVGELVHTSNFSLFEAMSAVEVGNLKMDPGAQPQKGPALQDYKLQTQLSDAQLIHLMDHLLCLEATWHKGSSLAQTVYSSHYMMQQDRLAGNVPLAAYCQVVEALCLELNQLVLQGCVCEEEDFNVHTAGLPLDSATGAAAAANGHAATAPASSSSCSSSSSKAGSGCEKVLGAVSLAVDQLGGHHQQGSSSPSAALVSRLQFQKLLLQAVQRLRKRSKADLDMAAKLLLKASTELAVVKSTMHLGAGQSKDLLGFDPGLNSHLVPPVPPRVVEMQDMEQAVAHFESLLRQLVRTCSITTVNDYYTLREFLESFSHSRPHALSRSALHLQLLHAPPAPAADAKAATTAATSSSSSSKPELVPAWCPSEAMIRSALHLDQHQDLGKDVDLFLEQALIAVSNYCQAMLLNRCRQRRRLRRCLDDFGHLYHHGLNADITAPFQEYLKQAGWTWTPEHPEDVQGPLGTWVEAETCNTMIWHLLLGFELELYEPREFTMLFWYIDYLCSIIQQDTKQLQAAKPKPSSSSSTGSSSSSKAGKKGSSGGSKRSGGGGSAAAPAGVAGRDLQMQNALVLEGYKQMSLGMMRVAIALNMTGTLQQQELPFNTEMQRFDQRFGTFHMLTRPDPLGYDQYLHSTSTANVEAVQLYKLATDAFTRARQACQVLKANSSTMKPRQDVLDEMALLDKVAGQNGVVVQLLLRSGGRQMAVRFEQLHHRWFPALTLKTGAAAANTAAGATGKQ